MKNFIDKTLNKFGYYKSSIPKEFNVSEAEILEMFRTYGQTKAFKSLLHKLCNKDKDMYFAASSDSERFMIHGAYQRTNYFISLIQKSNGTEKGKGSSNNKQLGQRVR